MEDEKEAIALKTFYDEVVLAFEEASDKAEDLPSPKSSFLGEVTTWLENATASLISWGIDTRADAGSLAAVEGTALGKQVRFTLGELQEHLENVFNERSAQSAEHESTADEDPMATMSSLIGMLQDFVRPIRMAQASISSEGPYRNLKQQVNDIYDEHIRRQDRPGPPALEQVLTAALHGQSSSRDRVEAQHVFSDQNLPSVASKSGSATSPPMEEATSAKLSVNTENRQQASWELATSSQASHLDSIATDDIWSEVGTALRTSCEINWQGVHFITPHALSEIMPDATVRRILQSLQSVPEQIADATFEDKVLVSCKKILAVCLYARLAPSFFFSLVEGTVSDQQLPIDDSLSLPPSLHNSVRLRSADVDVQSLRRFCNAQWTFTPVRLGSGLDENTVRYDDSAVLPIKCDLEKDLLGRGTFSNVYSVHISPDLHGFSGVCDVTQHLTLNEILILCVESRQICHETVPWGPRWRHKDHEPRSRFKTIEDLESPLSSQPTPYLGVWSEYISSLSLGRHQSSGSDKQRETTY